MMKTIGTNKRVPTKNGARNTDMVYSTRGNSCNAGLGIHITPSGSEIGVNMVARKKRFCAKDTGRICPIRRKAHSPGILLLRP